MSAMTTPRTTSIDSTRARGVAGAPGAPTAVLSLIERPSDVQTDARGLLASPPGSGGWAPPLNRAPCRAENGGMGRSRWLLASLLLAPGLSLATAGFAERHTELAYNSLA